MFPGIDIFVIVNILVNICVASFGNCTWPVDGLVGVFAFENNFEDSSTFRHGTTVIGNEPQFVGKNLEGLPFKISVKFDGTNYVDIGSSLGLIDNGLVGDYTLSSWTKVSQNVPLLSQRFLYGSDGDGGFHTEWTEDRLFAYECREDMEIQYRLTLPSNKTIWNHVAVTSTELDPLKIYLNGIVANETQEGTHMMGCDSSWFTGDLLKISFNGVEEYTGEIGCVHIYNRTLSPSEIYALYEDGCSCFADYHTCYGKIAGSCSHNGNCLKFGNCSCFEDYYGLECNITQCHGKWNNDTSSNGACHGGVGGECNRYDECSCFEGYFEQECNVTTCFGVWNNDTSPESLLCGGHGNCVAEDKCVCGFPYNVSETCEIYICGGIPGFEKETVCSGKGLCVRDEVCDCMFEYRGQNCEQQIPIDDPVNLCWTERVFTGNKNLRLLPFEMRNSSYNENTNKGDYKNQDILYYGETFFFNKKCRSDAVIIKLSPTGKILWGSGYGGRTGPLHKNDELDTTIVGIVEVPLHQQIVFTGIGYRDPLGSGQSHFVGVSSKNGEILWSRTIAFSYEPLKTNTVYDIVALENGNAVAFSFDGYNSGMWGVSYYIIEPANNGNITVFRFSANDGPGQVNMYNIYPDNIHCSEYNHSSCYSSVKRLKGTPPYGYNTIIIRHYPDFSGIYWVREFYAMMGNEGVHISNVLALKNGDCIVITALISATKLGYEIAILKFDQNGDLVYKTFLSKRMMGDDIKFQYLQELSYPEPNQSILFKIDDLEDSFFVRFDHIKREVVEFITLNDEYEIDSLIDSGLIQLKNENSKNQFLLFHFPDSISQLSRFDMDEGLNCTEVSEAITRYPGGGSYGGYDFVNSPFLLVFATNTTFQFDDKGDQFKHSPFPNIKQLSFFDESDSIDSYSDMSEIVCYHHRIWCHGVTRANETYVCSGHGDCSARDNCTCQKDYVRDDCSSFKCFGKEAGKFDVCNFQNGTCVSLDHCENCKNGFFGDQCELFECDGIPSNVTQISSAVNTTENLVCRGHGKCVLPDACQCEDLNYDRDGFCSWNCWDYYFQDEDVCSAHGKCISYNNCSCDDGFKGEMCEYHSCWGVFHDDEILVCGGHGSCVSKDVCFCSPAYSSSFTNGPCDGWFCDEFFKNDSKACSSKGRCVAHRKCECDKGYFGSFCEQHECFSVNFRSDKVCSGRGECTEPEVCVCDTGFTGSECNSNIYILSVMTPILASLAALSGMVFLSIVTSLICFVLFCCYLSCGVCGCCLLGVGVIAFLQKKRLKRFSVLGDVNLLIQEQEAESDSSIAHIRINKNLFEINYKEIKIVRLIGEGGSNSSVYLSLWKNRRVAFKCFKTRTLCSSQDVFDEFEREVQIMSSISHPNVIRFFGCSLNPPRVGILMEFCDNGEIFSYIRDYRKEKKGGVPIGVKLRLMKEICGGMDYLHSRSIIHRDLKCENVLIDSTLSCKIMDFGVSRIVKPSDSHKTKRVGTSVFMAPEVTCGNEYTDKCDVFSFAIMMFIIITEDNHPYGEKNEYNCEMKVANNKNFRPSLTEFKKKLKMKHKNTKGMNWLVETMKKCWNHDPAVRPDFSQLMEKFDEETETYDGGEDGGEKEKVGDDEDDESESESENGSGSESESESEDDDDDDEEDQNKISIGKKKGKSTKKDLEKEIVILRRRLRQLGEEKFEDF